MRITAGLLEFEIYLKHLQNKFKSDEENNNMDIVLQNSQTLVKNLRPKVSASSLATVHGEKDSEDRTGKGSRGAQSSAFFFSLSLVQNITHQ